MALGSAAAAAGGDVDLLAGVGLSLGRAAADGAAFAAGLPAALATGPAARGAYAIGGFAIGGFGVGAAAFPVLSDEGLSPLSSVGFFLNNENTFEFLVLYQIGFGKLPITGQRNTKRSAVRSRLVQPPSQERTISIFLSKLAQMPQQVCAPAHSTPWAMPPERAGRIVPILLRRYAGQLSLVTQLRTKPRNAARGLRSLGLPERSQYACHSACSA